jgi:cytochrome c5
MSDVVWSSVPDEPGRGLAEILYREPTYEDRQKTRREQSERDRLAARAQVAADGAETHGWLSRLRGQGMPTAADVLARARRDDGPDRSDAVRRQAARRVLREHGLEDVLGGGPMTVLDVNMGCLESPRQEVASRSASELDSADLRRSIRQAAEGAEYIARVKQRRQAEVARSAVSAAEISRSAVAAHDRGCEICRDYQAMGLPQASDDAYWSKVDSLVAKGFSRDVARLACTPHVMAVR